MSQETYVKQFVSQPCHINRNKGNIKEPAMRKLTRRKSSQCVEYRELPNKSVSLSLRYTFSRISFTRSTLSIHCSHHGSPACNQSSHRRRGETPSLAEAWPRNTSPRERGNRAARRRATTALRGRCGPGPTAAAELLCSRQGRAGPGSGKARAPPRGSPGHCGRHKSRGRATARPHRRLTAYRGRRQPRPGPAAATGPHLPAEPPPARPPAPRFRPAARFPSPPLAAHLGAARSDWSSRTPVRSLLHSPQGLPREAVPSTAGRAVAVGGGRGAEGALWRGGGPAAAPGRRPRRHRCCGSTWGGGLPRQNPLLRRQGQRPVRAGATGLAFAGLGGGPSETSPLR